MLRRKGFELMAKIISDAARRADGRLSEFGMHQPKRPEKQAKKLR